MVFIRRWVSSGLMRKGNKMATIIRCDRCGADEDANGIITHRALRREDAKVIYDILGVNGGVWGNGSVSVDLCQMCKKDLHDSVGIWWSSGSLSASSPLTTMPTGDFGGVGE